MDELTKTVIERGDLAHLALFLWATGATGLLVWTLKELVAALPPGVPLAIEAPCRATAELPALERAKRAYRALTALVED